MSTPMATIRATQAKLMEVGCKMDVTVGIATIPYGYTNDGKFGWRLPGCANVIDNKADALYAAHVMNRVMGG